MITVTMLALIACADIPRPAILEDTVDTIEINKYYDGEGNLIFTQAMFKDLCMDGNSHVMDWRMVRDRTSYLKIEPRRDYQRRGCSVIWSSKGVLRKVRAHALIYTWTQYDPEVADRKVVPQAKRRRLTPERGPTTHSGGYVPE